jgi:hypothetical protein
MSKATYWAAKQQPARPLDKLVLIAFADHVDKVTGECFPSVAAICEWTGCDRKTVMKSTASLEAAGLLVDTGRRCGRTRQVKVYRLPFETVPDAAPLAEAVPETAPLKSTFFPTERSQKRDTEPPTEPSSTKTTSSPKRGAPAKARLPADFVPVMTGKTAAVVAGWPPGQMATELEAMADWHAKEGKLSADWQASWRTWVRNATKWDNRNGLPQRNDHAAGTRAIALAGPRRGYGADMLAAALARPEDGPEGDPRDCGGAEGPLPAYLRRRP